LQIRVLYSAGRQAEALRAYEDIRALLADELGIEPGRELQQRRDERCEERRRDCERASAPGARRRSDVQHVCLSRGSSDVERG
jgi:DNA-binding SARP family transcriptional activator